MLSVLDSKGYATIPEPGRRIVAEEIAGTGDALPWVDMKAFALRAVAMARSDLASAEDKAGFVFFDRGLIDAAVALQFAGGEPYSTLLDHTQHYSPIVFLAPPWPEIYTQDDDRRHGFECASDEYDRLEAALIDLKYDVCILPKISIIDRVDFVLNKLK